MENIYSTRRDVATLIASVTASLFGGLMLGLFIILIVTPLREKWWVLIVTVLGLLIIKLYGFIKSKNSYYSITDGILSFYENKIQKWSVPVNQITEIDSKQVHTRKKHRSGSIYTNIAFLVLAGGQEYEALEVMEGYDKFLQDLKQTNPNIQFTDLTTKSETEYLQAGINAERKNEYTSDNLASKVFGNWLSPKAITYGTTIIIIALVILLIYALSS